MKPSKGLPQKLRWLLLAPACIGCLFPFAHAQLAPATPKPTAEETAKKNIPVETGPAKSSEDVVALSPFEVVSDTKGYYASNTMSGTRFNSKIEDLASAITVVTKEQMQDFAMLDINDVFLYTPNTEGTGTYTDYTVDRNGSYTDNVEMNPQGANRVRGIAAANVSLGNFETMGRTPVDPLAIDGVEVSRGPNSNIFGLGNPSGTLNQIPASANAQRDRTQLQARGDSYGGYRTSLDFNRVLVKNKLALRGSVAFQHDGYIRKPSGTNTVRYNGMVKFQPFRNTSITASYGYYHMNGTRVNAAPPRDQLAYWIASGMPTWDPVTQQVHLGGRTVGTFPTTTNFPDYFLNTFTGSTRGQVFVDNNAVAYWSTPTSTATTNPPGPLGAGQAVRLVASSGAAGVALGHITAQPLFTTTPTVMDKSIYDWETYNLSAMNRVRDRSGTYNVSINQRFLDTPRQTLDAQLGFFREDANRYARNIVGEANQNGQSGQLIVDVNERMIDGTPNPFFLRPFIGTDEPATYVQPYKWDTYRAQLGYKLDLTHEKTALRWLGMHQITGYDEYKYRQQRQERYRDVIGDSHAWVPSANLRVAYFRYYVGDKNGSNVDYAPSPKDFKYGVYPFTYGDATTNVFFHEPTLLTQGAQTDNGGGGSNTKTLLKTVGGVIQSHLFSDRLVTTFGLREDRVYARSGLANSTATPLVNSDGLTYNYVNFNHWAAGDWRSNSGKTKTGGAVLKPFREAAFLTQLNSQGTAGHFLASALRGLTLTYNKSDSFTPQSPAQDIFLKILPNQTGAGKDYGFALNLFDTKLVIRVNRYDNKSLNARNGDANTLVQRVLRHDVSQTDPFQLHNKAVLWVTAQNPAWTTDQIEDEVAKQIGIARPLQTALANPFPALAATNDINARGTEVEINYNPTNFWTISASGTDTQSITTNVSASVQQWIDQRMPIWTTIKDPTIDPRVEPQQLWWTHNYGGSQTAQQNYQTFVEAPYGVIHAQEGKAKPEIRRYNFRVSTNFRLSGVTENRYLKNVNVGGAVRWEDKGAIGYYGVQKLPAIITALDGSHPIWDKANLYVDLLAGYRTKIWSDKIPVSLQLNIRNVQESGHLQPTGAFPDGTPNTYRIVDPRQFILTASFDL